MCSRGPSQRTGGRPGVAHRGRKRDATACERGAAAVADPAREFGGLGRPHRGPGHPGARDTCRPRARVRRVLRDQRDDVRAGHRESYDDWPEGWRFDDLLPYFMRSEASRGGNPALRGKNGPLRVGPASPVNPLLAAALDAAVECGYAAAEDISSGDETGFGAADLTIDGRRRQTAADAYLVPAMDRPIST